MASALMTNDLRLPPGFRFEPTDVELILDYLEPRVSNPNFKVAQFLIKEFDVFSVEPWRLPGDLFQYQSEQKDMYFFSQRHLTRKGSQRVSRIAGSGFWQGKGRDYRIEIGTKVNGAAKTKVIGHKTQLTFMIKKGTGCEKTDWIMHEFRLPCHDATEFNNLVLCRIHNKMAKRAGEEIVDRYVGEEEEEEVIERRLAKRRRTEKDVGNEEGAVVERRLAKRGQTEKDVANEEEAEPIVHKPEDQKEGKELERQVITGLLQELAVMEANGWTPPCGPVSIEPCPQPMSSLPAFSSSQTLPSIKSLEDQEVVASMSSDVGCVSFSPSEEKEAEAMWVNLMKAEERRLAADNDERVAHEACTGETTTYEAVSTENESFAKKNLSSLSLGVPDTSECFGDESDRTSSADSLSLLEILDFSSLPPWEDVQDGLNNST